MAAARVRSAQKSLDTRALLVRRVDYGESDLVLTLFTERRGLLSALARSARRSQKRFGGALEPMHTLRVRLDERPSSELFVLAEAKIEIPRMRLLSTLDRLEAAGRALGWVRRASPPRTPEPEVWSALDALLERLDAARVEPRMELASAGLALLVAFGWGIDLERCVSCGKPCPPDRPALIDVARGGLVCRECGGARLRVPGPARARLSRAAAGHGGALEPGDLDLALDLVERAFRAHLGFD